MNLQALATRLDVSTKTVASWVRKGVPHRRTKTGNYDFDLKAVQSWRQANLAPRPSTTPSSYAEARARKESALAELRELQVRQKKGELLERRAVEQKEFALGRRIREGLKNLPDRTAGILAAEIDQAKIHAILSKEIHQVLLELSDAKSQ